MLKFKKRLDEYIKISKSNLEGLGIDKTKFSNGSYYNNENDCFYLFVGSIDNTNYESKTKLLNSIKDTNKYRYLFVKPEIDYFNKPKFCKIK
jgi:hypothetical protein